MRADDTVALAPQRSGYYTAHVGKYFNGWGSNGDITVSRAGTGMAIDPTTYRYFDYAVGRRCGSTSAATTATTRPTCWAPRSSRRSGRRRPTSRGSCRSPCWPCTRAARGRGERCGTTTTTAPGAAEEPRWAAPKLAPRHQQQLAAKFPRGAPFNPGTGSPEAIAPKPELTEGSSASSIGGTRRSRRPLAVDEWIGTILDTLEETGPARHRHRVHVRQRFFHGEHRLAFQKYHLYEPSVHVPLSSGRRRSRRGG
ncbi:MAG: hypothetical protein R2699_05470 [Acidimicrobiales bacterium]